MDVIAHGLPAVPEAVIPRRIAPPAAREAEPTDPLARAQGAESARKPTKPDTPDTSTGDPPPQAPTHGWEPHSSLKFSVKAADVDAKFEIHKATSKVTVTMYDRETGEVLREFPSRHVLDAIASIMDRGLQVDTTS